MEQYAVKFWRENESTGYWEQTEKTYHAKGKNAHKRVQRMWEKENRGKKVDLVSIIYV